METQTKIIIAIVGYCIFAFVLSLFSPQTLRGGIMPRLLFPFLIINILLKQSMYNYFLKQQNKQGFRKTMPGVWHYNKLQKQWHRGTGCAPNKQIYLEFCSTVEVYTIQENEKGKYILCETFSAENYYDKFINSDSIQFI